MKNLTGTCPVCAGTVSLPENVEESEIIACKDCSNRIVVSKISDGKAVLNEAPKIEEDWGQ